MIPARANSKRLPNKNMALLNGEPLVVRAARAACQSRLDLVIVSSESQEVLDAVSEANVGDPRLDRRPMHLSADDLLPTEIIKYLLWQGLQAEYDYAMCIQPDIPFRTTEDINAMIDIAVENDADFVGAYRQFRQKPVTLDGDGRIQETDFLGHSEYFRPTGIGEMYRTSLLMTTEKYGRAFAYLPPKRSYASDVDELSDLQAARALSELWEPQRERATEETGESLKTHAY